MIFFCVCGYLSLLVSVLWQWSGVVIHSIFNTNIYVCKVSINNISCISPGSSWIVLKCLGEYQISTYINVINSWIGSLCFF